MVPVPVLHKTIRCMLITTYHIPYLVPRAGIFTFGGKQKNQRKSVVGSKNYFKTNIFKLGVILRSRVLRAVLLFGF